MTTTSDKEGQHDRELLELAAKAAGIDIEFSIFKDESFICFYSGGDCFNSEWNPLLDDGDALRLAVKLNLAVMPYPVFESHKHSVVVSQRNLEHSRFEVVELYETDPYAATRRAIVRAAAEIGKKL
jgi:hypothetical protein